MLNKKHMLEMKEPPMTIISAMKESESSILLASDSEVSINGIRLNYGNKLCRHPDANLAWAILGDHTIGADRFTSWLKAYKPPFPDWETFSDKAIEKFSELNGQRRKLMELSGVKPTAENELCDCLLVGYLDRPNILVLNDNGIATLNWRFDFESIGVGRLHAWVAYKALMRFEIPPLPKMRSIMEAVVTSASNCNQPVYIWRVSQNGIFEGLERDK